MKWISIDDEFPDTPKFLAVNKDKDMAVVWESSGDYIRGSFYTSCEHGCGGCDYFDNITHWMPLPEFPEELK